MTTMNVTVRVLDGHLAVGRQEDDQVLLLDRPVRAGGTGLGFNGGHLMLLGWGACFKSTLLAAAEGRGIDVNRLEIAVAGETADAPYRFAELRMRVLLEMSGATRNGTIYLNSPAAAVRCPTLSGRGSNCL